MGRRGCLPWRHQFYLRLDDWTVECTRCGRVKREPRRAHRAGHLFIPTSSELGYVKETTVLSNYRKTLAAVGGVVLLVVQALADWDVSPTEWGAIATAVAAAVGVYALENKPA